MFDENWGSHGIQSEPSTAWQILSDDKLCAAVRPKFSHLEQKLCVTLRYILRSEREKIGIKQNMNIFLRWNSFLGRLPSFFSSKIEEKFVQAHCGFRNVWSLSSWALQEGAADSLTGFWGEHANRTSSSSILLRRVSRVMYILLRKQKMKIKIDTMTTGRNFQNYTMRVEFDIKWINFELSLSLAHYMIYSHNTIHNSDGAIRARAAQKKNTQNVNNSWSRNNSSESVGERECCE